MRRIAAAALIAAVALAGCSNDPSSPSGDLPIVENLRIDEDASKGDSVVLIWDAVDAEVDGYHIFYSTTVPGDWNEIEATPETTWTHVATSTGYYEIKASEGLNYSSDFSNRVDTRAESNILEQEMRVGTESNGLMFYDQGAGWALGCADSTGFQQDIYIDTLNNKLYLFSGNNDPANYPGGSDTKLCPRGCHGNVAPEASSAEWVDSVQVTDFNWVFVKLDNNYYTEVYVDSVFTNGADLLSFEYQIIEYLRLFNVL